MTGIVLHPDKDQMNWFRHFLWLDRDYLKKVTDQLPPAIASVHQVHETIEHVISTPLNATWLNWLTRALKWLALAVSQIWTAQEKVEQLKQRIVQVEAILVAIERKLPVSGPDLVMGRYVISWGDLCIARRKRQMTDENFYFSCDRLRTWLVTELRLRGERAAA